MPAGMADEKIVVHGDDRRWFGGINGRPKRMMPPFPDGVTGTVHSTDWRRKRSRPAIPPASVVEGPHVWLAISFTSACACQMWSSRMRASSIGCAKPILGPARFLAGPLVGASIGAVNDQRAGEEIGDTGVASRLAISRLRCQRALPPVPSKEINTSCFCRSVSVASPANGPASRLATLPRPRISREGRLGSGKARTRDMKTLCKFFWSRLFRPECGNALKHPAGLRDGGARQFLQANR